MGGIKWDYLISLRKIKEGIFPVCNKIEGVVDLSTVGGNFKVFQNSELHDRYFDWYTEDVSLEEVKQIYQKINREYLLSDTVESEKE